jgi:NAD(P)-dependent dehydrogenase (short-subunit alcohol dehydrogenase family)
MFTPPCQNQVAVVTGGGRGLGRAFAQTLASAGATVAVIARSVDELAETVALIEQSGGTARAYPTDLTDDSAVRAAFAEIGAVDLLVNNAAAPGTFGPFWETDLDEWWRVMDINLRAQLLCAHCVLPGMIARRRGRIVNINTGARPIAHLSGYMTSKTALLRFTECVAAEARQFGVSLFSLAPGTVRTRLSEHLLNSPEGRQWLPWYHRIYDEGLDLPPERAAQLLLAIATGKADSLSGRYLTPLDDLDALIAHSADIERQELHSLRVQTLGGK